ncbi:hypothetical protein [Escherichia phage Mt1B1_P10]|uniref:Uncharacterized protein n=1 Tax=Escherichia phage Mt1B1_P10 TaxID=2743960 RepID=A0A7H0XC92_9CAUD|nr:hypothetical protein [Escherichia phage Mt1B1_P10]
MKQRAIKRCIKRAQKQLRRGTFKGRMRIVSFNAKGMVFVRSYQEGRTIYVNDKGIGWGVGAALGNRGGHGHWVGSKVEVAISYV